MEPMDNIPQKNSSPAIPIAIICGFAMIALAIFFTNKNDSAPTSLTAQQATNQETQQDGRLRPVDETDYIYGNPNAPIMIVEYSDYECPFCKQFHATMHQIMDEFGVGGKVAWVYRQLPLPQLHPNATKISEAALCVGDIGGNSAFWSFSNLIFDERDLDEPTNVTKLIDYAEEVGVDKNDYISCINSGRMQEAVLQSAEEGFRLGGQSTPYTVITVGDQEAVINGAQPYDVVESIVSNLIDQLEGNVGVPTATGN